MSFFFDPSPFRILFPCSIKPDTTWDDIKGELQERSAARAVASEDLCAAFLQEFKETDPWRVCRLCGSNQQVSTLPMPSF